MRAYILVVDSDHLVRTTICNMLEASGYLAIGIESMSRTLEVLHAVSFDALLISPGAIGLRDQLHAIDAKTMQPTVKIIMASAKEEPEFHQPPFDAYLRKPFSIPSLLQALACALPHLHLSSEGSAEVARETSRNGRPH